MGGGRILKKFLRKDYHWYVGNIEQFSYYLETTSLHASHQFWNKKILVLLQEEFCVISNITCIVANGESISWKCRLSRSRITTIKWQTILKMDIVFVIRIKFSGKCFGSCCLDSRFFVQDFQNARIFASLSLNKIQTILATKSTF